MSKLKIQLVVDNGDSNITIYKRGEDRPFQANTSHPAWEQILAGAQKSIGGKLTDAESDDIIALFLPGKRLSLSERIAYDDKLGVLYFDGDKVADELGEHILDQVREGKDYKPLIALFENIKLNPNPGSQEQLYRWIKTHKLTITKDGLIVGYKAVDRCSPKPWKSKHSGPAIVNGEPHTSGPVPQGPGDIVEMPRSEVTYDPGRACSSGLHVGNWSYVTSQYGQPAIKLEVHVNPRDVVSVPRDAQDSKIRACRYRVIGPVTGPYTTAVRPENGRMTAPGNVAIAEAKRVRYPSESAFAEIQGRARRRKRNIVKYALKHTTWNLIDGRDGKDRKDWSL